MPAFAAAMASWLGMPCLATAEEQNTIEPPPVVIMLLTVGLRMLKQLYRLTFITCQAPECALLLTLCWQGASLSNLPFLVRVPRFWGKDCQSAMSIIPWLESLRPASPVCVLKM